MREEVKKIYGVTKAKLNRLQALPDNALRAELAELRRGVGRAPGELPALWGAFLTDFPEEWYGYRGEPSREEWAVYTALTMFALHQQGNDFRTKWMDTDDRRFGQAVRMLAPTNDDSDEALNRVRNRFNIIATSANIRELANHLRAMIHFLRDANIAFDYADLAVDLYRFMSPISAPQVKLKWGQDFYRFQENNQT